MEVEFGEVLAEDIAEADKVLGLVSELDEDTPLQEDGGEQLPAMIDDSVDWFEQLTDDEVVQGSDNKPHPLLAGLRRLAKPFIAAEDCRVNFVGVVPREIRRTLKRYGPKEDGSEKLVILGMEEVVGTDHLPFASVTFVVILNDGRRFVDSADAFLGNCDKLGNFPTAVASARAEGRVLRKVLGIAQHVAEEMTEKTASEELTSDEDNAIAPEQKKLIESLVNKVEGATLKLVFEKSTARDVTDLAELTGAEATAAIKMLNGMKKKGK